MTPVYTPTKFYQNTFKTFPTIMLIQRGTAASQQNLLYPELNLSGCYAG